MLPSTHPEVTHPASCRTHHRNRESRVVQALLDYLDILDDFIDKLPEGTESGKGFWQGAAYSARYKTETALGVRESDDPGHFKPLKSVQAQRDVL
jgi:hypothetical protein